VPQAAEPVLIVCPLLERVFPWYNTTFNVESLVVVMLDVTKLKPLAFSVPWEHIQLNTSLLARIAKPEHLQIKLEPLPVNFALLENLQTSRELHPACLVQLDHFVRPAEQVLQRPALLGFIQIKLKPRLARDVQRTTFPALDSHIALIVLKVILWTLIILTVLFVL
jgi:hypothetical protein